MEDIKIDKKFFDTSYPLLDKFRELAPGSFKHCQNVANICESIAIELELNADILKISGLYHDIGKLNNPLHFSENQLEDENIHDTLEPFVSYHMITRHVGDSVIYLLQAKGLPHDVVEIISQHHGTTILQAFFSKTENEPEDKYRYKCSKPSSTEAAILMIVDSVEATARSLFNNNTDDKSFIKKAINGTIERLVDDGQLDNMKIGTLKVAKRILFKELESIYHKRVTYENKKTVGEERTDNGLEVDKL